MFVNRKDGAAKRCDLRHLFLFIGADPHSDWLANAAAIDDKGFLLTGRVRRLRGGTEARTFRS